MFPLSVSKVSIKFIIAAFLAGACVLSQFAPVIIVTKNGMPGRRVGGGTRHSIESVYHG